MPAPASEQFNPPGDSGDIVVQVCLVCGAPFRSVQDCLAHELLKHSSKPQKQLRQRLNAITKLFTSKQTQSERTELRDVLKQSASGGHLRAVLDFYCSDLGELEECYDQVRNCIEKELKGRAKVYPFGSLVTGLALKESDIDLYLQPCDDPPMAPKQMFNKVSNFLRRSKCFADVFAIRHARVPIIRCKHQLTGLSIDINMSNPNSTYNSKFVGELMRRDERLRELCLFLKIWAKKLKLIGHGSMTSYCLISLILVSLQVQDLLPSIKQLQSFCLPDNVWGVNYAYILNLMPAIPAQTSTLELIRNFFVYYSTVDFGKSVVSPFLGCVLDRETSMGTPGGFPEYEAQLLAMQEAVGEPPEPFQLERSMCVQDPFELQHNVAKTLSQSSVCYLRQCLILAAQASSDPELQVQPEKLYEYLLFGLADKLMANQHKEKPTPPKQQKKEIKLEETTTVQLKEEPKVTKFEAPADQSAPPIVRTHVITPTTNDLKCLRASELSLTIAKETVRPIYYYWMSCYVDTIKDVLTQLYVLNVESVSDGPHYHRWRISSSLDTWTGRSFQRGCGQSFFAHQLQQTIEFSRTRAEDPAYVVNLRGFLSLQASEDYKELRLDVQPLAGDLLGLQRNSPLTKLFKAFKNLLGNYSFKEKSSTWKYYAKSEPNGAP